MGAAPSWLNVGHIPELTIGQRLPFQWGSSCVQTRGFHINSLNKTISQWTGTRCFRTEHSYTIQSTAAKSQLEPKCATFQFPLRYLPCHPVSLMMSLRPFDSAHTTVGTHLPRRAHLPPFSNHIQPSRTLAVGAPVTRLHRPPLLAAEAPTPPCGAGLKPCCS